MVDEGGGDEGGGGGDQIVAALDCAAPFFDVAVCVG